jgi:alanine dehydrogenase
MSEKVLWLSASNIENVVSMRDTVGTVEAVLKAQGQGEVLLPVKIALFGGADDPGFFHAMPAAVPGLNAAGMKWVGGFTDNQAKGLPYISGVVVLNDTETGIPYAVMDGAAITNMRTPAASAVGAKYLAKRNSQSLGIIGAGVEGRGHVEAMLEVLPSLKRVSAYDIKPELLSEFVSTMSAKFPALEITAASDARTAIESADVVVVATTAVEPVIEKEWVKPGSLVIGIDAFFDVPYDLRLSADKYYLDEFGHVSTVMHRGTKGDMPLHSGEHFAEIGEVVAGKKAGRESDEETILFITIGLAIEDIGLAKLAYDRAIENGVGTRVTLF